MQSTLSNFAHCTFIVAAIGSSMTIYASNTATSDGTGQIEEITVTADFRPNDLQSIPASITVMTEEVITSRNAQHLEEMITLAPNVNFSSGSSRARFFQIRGIGERSQFKEPVNPSVGMMIDDIDFTGIGTAATLFDVEQVEVLRGPQGTRYGANALGGLINIQTKAPTNELAVNVETTEASYNTLSHGLAVSGPLVNDVLSGRIAIHHYLSDGFIENTYLDRDDTNNRDEITAHARLRLLATDRLRFDFSLLHANIDNGYDAFSLDNNRKTLSDEPGRDTQKTDAFAVNSQWQANDALKLEAIATYADSELEYSYDEDWTYVGIAPDWEYSSFDQYLRDRKNYSLELRLLSDEAGRLFNETTDWAIGIYHLAKKESLVRNYTYNTDPFESQYDTTNTALFAQIDSRLTDRLKLVIGFRTEQWNAEYEDSQALIIDTDDTLYGGKIGLDYQLTDNQMIYGSISRGYKAGGVNTDARLDDELRDFDTEYSWNTEAGIKSRWLDNTLLSRIALFYAQRKDQQVKGSFMQPKDENSPEGPFDFIDHVNNAAKGKNYGLEAELNWLPTQQLELFANLGLLRAKFDEYVTPDTEWAAGQDMSGRDQAHAPRYQFAIGGQYNFTNEWYSRIEIEGKDKFYFSDRHDEESEAYELLNAKIGFQHQNWHISIWGRNLTDEDYATRGFGFANDPRDEYTTNGYIQLGEPRMIGLTVNWNL